MGQPDRIGLYEILIRHKRTSIATLMTGCSAPRLVPYLGNSYGDLDKWNQVYIDEPPQKNTRQYDHVMV